MKLMTYNILNGAKDRLSVVLDVIKHEKPDYLTINEANTFIADNDRNLKFFAKEADFPYYDIALSGEYDYHVAVFSKYQFKTINKLRGFRNACLETLINCDFGDVSICGTHLTPYTEDERLKELNLIILHQKKYKNKIILGDLNSLSPDDNYNPKMIILNDIQKRKFTKNDKLQFKVISRLKNEGYVDTSLQLGANHKNTVPTPFNTDNAHGFMRLDYIFISTSLIKNLREVNVIKNELTNMASDHYPVTATLE